MRDGILICNIKYKVPSQTINITIFILNLTNDYNKNIQLQIWNVVFISYFFIHFPPSRLIINVLHHYNVQIESLDKRIGFFLINSSLVGRLMWWRSACSLVRVLSSRCLWWCEWCQDYLCIGASHGQHWQTIARRPATEITPCVFLPFRLIWPSHSRPTDLKYQTKDRGMFSTRHSTLDSLHSKPPHMVGTILELILRRYIDCIESWR